MSRRTSTEVKLVNEGAVVKRDCWGNVLEGFRGSETPCCCDNCSTRNTWVLGELVAVKHTSSNLSFWTSNLHSTSPDHNN